MDVVWLHDEDFDSIGDAIREKLDTETEYKLGQMTPAIDSIPTPNCDVDKIIDGTITEVYLPGIDRINRYVFNGCTELTSVTAPEVTRLGQSTFENCTSLININIPELTRADTYTFRNCTSLVSVEFPNLITIDNNLFESCTNLTSIFVPNLTSIGYYSFRNCSLLNNLVFPNITSIMNGAFQNCTSLTSLTIYTNSVCTLNNVDAFNDTPIASGTGYIYVPAELVDSYKAATNWSTYASQIVAIPSE